MRAAHASVDEAIKVGHANSMCVALADGAGLIAILVDDATEAERFVRMLTEHAEQHALGVWRTYGMALRGRLLMRRGEAADGAVLLRSALAELRGTPFDIRYQLYLVWLAETLGAAGQAAEAHAAIDEALDRAERTEERWYFPELLRLRGELLIQEGASGASECFTRSLDWAQRQGALAWQLRTAMSLARMQSARTAAESRTLVGSVLGRFTEGYATADLVAAHRLMAELEA